MGRAQHRHLVYVLSCGSGGSDQHTARSAVLAPARSPSGAWQWLRTCLVSLGPPLTSSSESSESTSPSQSLSHALRPENLKGQAIPPWTVVIWGDDLKAVDAMIVEQVKYLFNQPPMPNGSEACVAVESAAGIGSVHNLSFCSIHTDTSKLVASQQPTSSDRHPMSSAPAAHVSCIAQLDSSARPTCHRHMKTFRS